MKPHVTSRDLLIEKSLGRSLAGVCYLSLSSICYVVVAYAQIIMPSGAHWSFDWEYSCFLMTVAAKVSLVLLGAGIFDVIVCRFFKRQPVSNNMIVGIWMSGLLPILMFFLFPRWLQVVQI